MSKLVLMPGDRQIELQAGDTILEAALRAHVNLPYGCRSGACGNCKGQILEGVVEHGPHALSALSETERASGLALFCCSRPQGDVWASCREIDAVRDVQPRDLSVRVEKIEKITADVAVLWLRPPQGEQLQFLAGQYIDIHAPDGKKRSFSLACAPRQDGLLELHIRHTPGGAFAGYVWNQMKPGEILRINGPLGSFFLREDSAKPILLVATGTGFAPIKSMLEHLFSKGVRRKVVLYWGARNSKEIYMPQVPVAHWQSGQHDFSYIPVLSEPAAEDAWTGRTGMVHEAVLQDIASFAAWQVYACGAPVMVEAAHAAFTARGLPHEEFYSDAFFAAKPAGK